MSRERADSAEVFSPAEVEWGWNKRWSQYVLWPQCVQWSHYCNKYLWWSQYCDQYISWSQYAGYCHIELYPEILSVIQILVSANFPPSQFLNQVSHGSSLNTEEHLWRFQVIQTDYEEISVTSQIIVSVRGMCQDTHLLNKNAHLEWCKHFMVSQCEIQKVAYHISANILPLSFSLGRNTSIAHI